MLCSLGFDSPWGFGCLPTLFSKVSWWNRPRSTLIFENGGGACKICPRTLIGPRPGWLLFGSFSFPSWIPSFYWPEEADEWRCQELLWVLLLVTATGENVVEEVRVPLHPYDEWQLLTIISESILQRFVTWDYISLLNSCQVPLRLVRKSTMASVYRFEVRSYRMHGFSIFLTSMAPVHLKWYSSSMFPASIKSIAPTRTMKSYLC